jgi:hypothetical protein
MAEYGDLTDEQRAELRRPFDELSRTIERQTLVAVIRDTVRHFDDNGYRQQLATMAQWSALARQPAPDPQGGSDTTACAEPRVEYVTRTELRVPFDRAWLADEADVDAYLDALKAAMMREIGAGKRVQV